MVPKLPLALLAIVLCLYAWGAIADLRLRKQAELAVEGPVAQVYEGARGRWEVEWPAWPARKGDPILCADGRTVGDFTAPPASSVFLRVRPQDCAHFSGDAVVEDGGWFRAVAKWLPIIGAALVVAIGLWLVKVNLPS